MSRNDVMYTAITEKICAIMEKGIVPWRKPWDADCGPCNIVTKRQYSGINIWMLAFSGFSSRYWGTFNQLSGMGGKIKKGEKATKIYFWSFINQKVLDEKGKPKLNSEGKAIVNSFPILKEWNVFNYEQCTDLPEIKETKKEKSEKERLEHCEKIVAEFAGCPEIQFGNSRAAYSPTKDMIVMPNIDNFHSSADYYSTLFHEMSHSTGHSSRLDRKEGMQNISFGSHEYSREELIAEFSASFLCATVGIENETLDNSASYIHSWSKKFREDPAMLMCCASKAQKSANHILGIAPTKIEE